MPPPRVAFIRDSAIKSGIGFGSALAIVISYTAHQSVLWAIIHGFLGWLYVLYFVLTR
jgi:ABC-type Fe3+-siderophore transport system permease subunit